MVALLSSAPGCRASTEIGPIEQAGQAGQGATDDASVTTATAEEIDDELTSEMVFDAIENSVVFVLTPDELSSGSGVVIDGGWILTNAHVVDRHESVRIGRSDGRDLGLFPVHAIDWVFDLALVGPFDDPSLEPIARGESGSLSLGARVLLAGFPDEDSIAPTPTLTEGIVSRRRFVAIGDYPFLQVDATIAPGQSGGALVNGRGELVGISGLEFGEGEFGLAFASDPMWPRIEAMIASGGPEVPAAATVNEISGEVGPLRNFGFELVVDESGSIDMLVVSAADVWVDLQTPGGITVTQSQATLDPFRERGVDTQLYIDELVEGGEDVLGTVEPGIYQVLIGSFNDTIETVEITATNAMRTFPDVEESMMLPVGEVVEGQFDWVRDTDQWQLPLTAGDQVVITSDGISDTVLVVRLDDQVIAGSDDEGLGLFGTGSRVEFTAEATATYTVEVGTYDQTRWGYLIEAQVS